MTRKSQSRPQRWQATITTARQAADKVTSVTDADGVLADWQSVTDTLNTAESIDLPRGFGKD